MSYDLEFCVAAGSARPGSTDFQEYFRGRPWYRIQGSRAFYGNEDTGVYFWFETGERGPEQPPPVDSPQDGLQPAGLSFTINYVRPGIFALEAERELRALVERFSLSCSCSTVRPIDCCASSRSGHRPRRGWPA